MQKRFLRGQSIYEHWEEGMRTMHGLMVSGFPNLFLCGGGFVVTTLLFVRSLQMKLFEAGLLFFGICLSGALSHFFGYIEIHKIQNLD